jgi:hypothetical protein
MPNASCPFCRAEVKKPAIPLNLRICPNCLATFLPASLYAALRREVYAPTRQAWKRILEARGIPGWEAKATEAHPEMPICCLDHGQPLVEGEMPQYGHKILVPTCCDLQHIPPAEMVKVLDFGFEMEAKNGASYDFSLKTPYRRRGFFAFLNPLTKLLLKWSDKQPTEDSDLEKLQFIFKFEPILGEVPA